MITTATIKDFGEIREMARGFYSEAKYKDAYGVDIDEKSLIDFVVQFISDDDKVILFEHGKGMIAGIVVPWFFNRDHKVAQEMAWYVKPEHRHGMLSGRLYKAFEKWARERKASIFVMGALDDLRGERVGEFYRRCGMIPMESMYGKALWQQ